MKIAITSSDGSHVDRHFGHTDHFYVYELTDKKFSLIEKRKTEKYCESKGIKKGFAYFVRRDIDGKFDKFLEDFKLWREANLISNGKSILS